MSIQNSILRRANYLKIAKIAIGCCCAVLVANILGLRSSTSAGIITLLSIQNTKKETLSIAGKRLVAFFIAIAIALLVFKTLGFRVYAFGIFLFFFTWICYLFKLDIAISTNTVLVTHFWSAGDITLPLIINELCLLCIGVGIAVFINLYMPRNLPAIRQDQMAIDKSMQQIIAEMAHILAGNQRAAIPEFSTLRNQMEAALKRAYDNMNNTLAVDMRYYVQYIDMRMSQAALLEKIYQNISRIQFLPVQALAVSAFMEEIANSFYAYNNAEDLLIEWESRRQSFKTGPLPQTREEFEARAVLFQIANDLEYLLLAKKKFAESLTPWQISYFWKDNPKTVKPV